MRRQVAGSLVACVFAVMMAGCAATPQKPVVDVAAIKASILDMNQRYMAAVAAKDVDALLTQYAADARLLPSNGPRADGPEAIRKAWTDFLNTPGLSLASTSGDITVSEAGDMAVDVGTYQMNIAGPGGQPIQDVGKYVTIFKKVGTEWKISVETFNSDVPVAGQ